MLVRCRFKFRCSKSWDELDHTSEPAVRFCTSCKEKVFLCLTEEDLTKQTNAGNCVAISGVRRMTLGLPSTARASIEKLFENVKKN
jgi:hypothetical protein